MVKSHKRSAGIYCRISEDRNAESLGVARQEKDCRRLAVERGWTIVDVYVDNDLSGSKQRVARPEYQRLLADIEAGRIDAVIVWDLDRLTRQPRQLEAFVDICAAAGVHDLLTVSGDVNIGTGDGLLVARIKGAVAAEEARKLGQRVARKMQELAEDGRPNGGRRPYGFAVNRIDHDVAEATALRQAATTILDGGTLTDAARHTTLSPSSLKRSLCSPRIAGLRQHRGEIIGRACWAPIIDRADWERLKALLCRPARYSVPIHRHLLSGFARCGECDGTLSAQWRRNPTRVIYQCRSTRGGCGGVSVDGGHLERTVIDEVSSLIRTARARRALQRRIDRQPDNNEAGLVASIAEDDKRLIDLAAEVGELGISPPEWSAMRRPILDRIERARVELSKLHRREPLARIDLAAVAEEWDTMTYDQRRQTLRDLGVDVVVARAGKGARRFCADRVQVRLSWM